MRHGPGASEPRDLAVDEARVPLSQDLVPEPQPLHRVSAVVLDEHVRIVHETASDLEAPLRLKVEGHAPLVAVHHQERRRLSLQVGRHELSRGIPARDRLHLYDVGPHVGEHASTRRAGHDVRELDDAQVGKGSRVTHSPRNLGVRRSRKAWTPSR